jgi:ferredoxin-type protein NapH
MIINYKKIIWPVVLIISIGGLFYPKLGLLMYPMFFSIMITGFFKDRYWCGNICPRGAFLDLILKKFSPKKQIPNFFKNKTLKYIILILMMSVFIINVIRTFNYWNTSSFFNKLGLIGVNMCLATTTIAIILGIFIHQRTWCTFCPMGTVQKKLHKVKKKVF